jgi:hypothetical protein
VSLAPGTLCRLASPRALVKTLFVYPDALHELRIGFVGKEDVLLILATKGEFLCYRWYLILTSRGRCGWMYFTVPGEPDAPWLEPVA